MSGVSTFKNLDKWANFLGENVNMIGSKEL